MTAVTDLTCREFIGFLVGYLEETLADDERVRFDAHLAICPDCVAYLESYRDTVRLEAAALAEDADIPAEVPEDLIRAVLASRRG